MTVYPVGDDRSGYDFREVKNPLLVAKKLTNGYNSVGGYNSSGAMAWVRKPRARSSSGLLFLCLPVFNTVSYGKEKAFPII